MNCKPGDMAIVIKCPSTPMFIGRIVEVLYPDNRFDVPHWRTAPDLIDPADGCRVVFADESKALESIADTLRKKVFTDWRYGAPVVRDAED